MDLVPDLQPWKLKSLFVHRLNRQTTPQTTPVLQHGSASPPPPQLPQITLMLHCSLFFMALRVASPGRGKEMQSWSISPLPCAWLWGVMSKRSTRPAEPAGMGLV